MATEESPQSLPEEITTSLASVWQRYSTTRPKKGSTEITGNVVRCLIPRGAKSFDDAMVEDPDRLASYRREAAAAVARSTRCRVVAMISEHDTDSDEAREVFVLETALTQPSFGERGWIAS